MNWGLILRVTSALLVLFFIYAAVVQFNDPDPILWVAIYGTAAGAACVQVLMPIPRLCSAVAAATFAITLVFVPTFVREQREVTGAFFESEVNREVMGLLIIVFSFTMLSWLAAHAAKQDKRSARKERS